MALLLESILRRFKDSSSRWIAAKYEYAMTNFMIENTLSFYNLTELNYVSSIEKFKSLAKIGRFQSTAYYQLWIDLPFSLVFFILIFVYGRALVLIPLLVSLSYILLVVVTSSKYFESQIAYSKDNDKQLEMLIETLENIHFIKAGGLEESQIIKFRRLLDAVSIKEYKSSQFKALPAVFAKKSGQISMFLMLVSGGFLLLSDSITFGQITACVLLGNRALGPIINVMNYYQQLQDVNLLKERIESMGVKGRAEDELPDFPDEVFGMIELVDLTYNDVQTGVEKKASTTINVGSFVAINPAEFVSYKSLLKMIVGRDTASSGKVLIDNLDISEWNMASAKGKIEYLSANVPLFTGNVIQNIVYFDMNMMSSGFEAAKLTGLDTLVSKMPEGFETELDSHMLNYLSSGFLQRLNLARAFVQSPSIIIFDRIDESMDEETLDMFKWLLKKLNKSTTIILVSWDEEILQLSDYQITEKDWSTDGR
jgi:ATP-binding cassette subfamily C protein LapB